MGWKRRVGAVQAHVTAAAAYPADDDIPDPPHDPDAAATNVTGGTARSALDFRATAFVAATRRRSTLARRRTRLLHSTLRMAMSL
jgi:hypothetical protein